MAKSRETEQAGLLPPQGLRARGTTASPEAQEFLRAAEPGGRHSLSIDGGTVPMQVVDSIGPDGAKLVELSAESALSIRAQRPDLRLVPVHYYTPASVEPEQVLSGPAGARSAAAATTITLSVVSKAGAKPVVNAFVVAFVDFKARTGAQGVTGDDGKVTLSLGKASI